MVNIKEIILNRICYTDLVYGRICKKLDIQKTNEEIEKYISEIIKETPPDNFKKDGKNYYIKNIIRGVEITINQNTIRVITVDKLKDKITPKDENN